MASTRLKIATFAPMPITNATAAVMVNAGVLRRDRQA